MRPAPNDIGEVARLRAEGSSLWAALGEFLDAFYEGRGDREAMLANAPLAPLPPEERAFLAAAAEHLSLRYGLPTPDWTQDRRYFLEHAYWPDGPGRNTRAFHLAQSPIAFRRRLIFTEGEPLRRKLGPRPAENGDRHGL